MSISQDRKAMLSNVSLYKCIMLFSVILGHCCIVFTGNNWGGVKTDYVPYLGEITNWLSTFHTYAFVFASGFLLAYGRYAQGKYRGKKDVWKRAKRLLVPYVVIAVFWAMPAEMLLLGSGIKETLKNYVFVLSAAQLWFLVMLFNVWLFFYFTSDLLMRIPAWIGVMCFVGIRLICVFLEKSGLPIGVFGISNALRYALLFYLGMLAERQLIRLNKSWLLCAVFLLIEIGTYAGYNYYAALPNINSYLKEILFTAANVSGVFLSWLVINCFNCERLTNQAWFSYINQCSMGIYLLHQQLLYISMRVFNVSWLHPVLFIVFNFIIAVAVSMIIVRLVRKTNVGRLIMGG